MNDHPLVTVVIPTWNRLLLVEEAVRSVIAQTYSHWELIVADDGSTDGTVERLNSLGDSRIQVLSAPHIRQVGHVRNRGAVAGSGELLAFLDSDNLWLPRKLELQVRALRETGAGWCYCGFEMMDADCNTIPLPADRIHLLSGDIGREVLDFKATIRMSTVVVGRKLFDAVGRFSEDPRLLFGEDYELYMQLAVRARAIALSDTLVRIRKHSDNTSAASNDHHELMTLIYEIFIARSPGTVHSRLAHRFWTRSLADAGAKHLSAGRLNRATRLFARSAGLGAHVEDWVRALVRGIRDGALRR